MKLSLLLVAACLLGGCPAGDDGQPQPADAPKTIDSPASLIDAPRDAPSSNVCTGQLYDRCTTNAQCMSNNCRMFNNLGYSLCTQACTPGGAACPTQGGAAVQCPNNAMICRPNAGNACTAPP